MAETPTGTVARATLQVQVNCVSGEDSYEATMEYLAKTAQPAMGWNAEGQANWAGYYVIYVNPGGQPLPEWGCQQMRI